MEARPNGHGSEPTRPIERILSEGQSLMVQVIKDPIGTKGARLSTQISIAGRMLVLPQEKTSASRSASRTRRARGVARS